MPFQYETFNDGEPLAARKIQKTTNNQFEMSQTYQERSRGLIAHKLIPVGYDIGDITTVINEGPQKLISLSATIYPDRYYLVEAQLGRVTGNGGFFGAFAVFLLIEGIYVSAMNVVTEWSSTSASGGAYVNHIFTSPSNIPKAGTKKVFSLWGDEITNGSSYTIKYANNTYQGRVRLSIIDMGGVQKANYYG